MTDRLGELFADGSQEQANLNEQVEEPETSVSEEEVEAVASEEGETVEETGATEETPDESSIEYWKQKVEELEREKRTLQSKKDREIWEMQQKLKQLEEAVLNRKEEPEQEAVDFDPEEIKELMFENPAEAIRKVLEKYAPEILENTLPKITQKQLTAKQQQLVNTWQADAERLARIPDYAEIVNNPEHPLMKAMAEFVQQNRDAYLRDGKDSLVWDALKYAHSKVKIKREDAGAKKKTSVVGKKSNASNIAPPSGKPSIDDLFD